MAEKKTRGLDKKYQSESFKGLLFECGEAGLNMSQTVRKLNLPRNFFKYANSKEPYLAGRDALAEKVRASIIAASVDSYLDRKLLCDRLGIFSEPFELERLETPADARNAISSVLQRYAEGLLTEQALNAITKAVMAFIESYSQTVLVDDINEIKALLEGRKDEEHKL